MQKVVRKQVKRYVLGSEDKSTFTAWGPRSFPGGQRKIITTTNILHAAQYEDEIEALSALRALPRDLSESITNVWPLILTYDVDGKISGPIESGGMVVNMNEYLDPASMLIAFELARIVLSESKKRDWAMQQLGLKEREAQDAWARLTNLMNAIRATEKRFEGAPDFLALESGNGDAE